MNGSPQNSEAVAARRTGTQENSADEDDWSAIVECVFIIVLINTFNHKIT